MKQKIALTVGGIIMACSIFQFFLQNIKTGTAMAITAIITGFIIANYDVIKKFKWGNVEVETVKKEIESIKEQAVTELQSQAKLSEEKIEKLNVLARDLALTYAKILFLQSSTRNQFGTPASKAALAEIELEVNRLLPMVIPDNNRRTEWIKKLDSIIKK